MGKIMRDAAKSRNIADEILDATDKLLSQYGYKKMTIDDLAREVGIGKGSVYLHFKSKEQIALSHVDRIVDRLINRLHEIATEKTQPDERLAKMVVERVEFRFRSVQHYTASLNELLASIRPALLERRRKHFEAEAKVFAKVVREGIESGIFRKLDPLETAAAMLISTNSLLPFSLSVKELGELDEIRKKAQQTARLLIYGLVDGGPANTDHS